MIERINIIGLFSLYNYDICRAEDSKVLILTGPNGFGKTTILQIINHFCTGKFWYFIFLPFTKIDIFFSDGTHFCIEKKKSESEVEKNQPIVISLYDENGVVLEEEFFDSNYIDYLVRRFRHFSFRYSTQNTEELLEEEYSNHVDDRVRTRMPKTLEYLQHINCLMIEEQRLMYLSKFRSEPVLVRTVEDIQKVIKQFYSEAQKVYNLASLKIDGSFVYRLSNMTPDNKGKHIKQERIYRDVVNKIAEFKKYGLVGELGVVSNLGVHYNQVLKLYLKDLYEKLLSLEPFYQKLHTFDKLVTSKELSYKRLLFEHDSMKVVNDNGKEIPIYKLSSGEQNLIVLCYKMVFELDDRNLLLIDEPEKSLHVAWLENLLDDYKLISDSTGCQMIIATHSPSFIHGNWSITYDLCENGKIQEFTTSDI